MSDSGSVDPRTPILVGCGQITDTTGAPSSARSNTAFCAETARLALADTRASIGAEVLGRQLDAVAVLEFFPDISPRFASPFGRCSNPPKGVANRLNATPRQLLYTHSGGNMPQYLVNRFAEEIARDETELALVCGSELLRSTQNARKSGLAIDHREDPGGEPTRIGDSRFGFSDEEARHDLRAAIHFYPLIENAIRGGLKRDVASHMAAMGRLFARLAAVAKDNPLATRREGYSAERLATAAGDNRWICFPYPRLMNSNAMIDQAAAVLVTSVGKARDWGIPQDRWVFLHGCADGTDTWVVSERERLDASPAIRGCARRALDMAGKTVADVAAFDLYSCFPSAVEVAMKEIGIAEDDPRPISVTGGLPFFGGPGNNYVTHSIAEMMNMVRCQPGSFGMVTANGNYLTKHSAGLYSTLPTEGPWRREDPKQFQAELDARPKQRVSTAPSGTGTIETYCVAYGKDAPEKAWIFGRLDGSNERFVAMAGNDPELLTDMLTREQLGRRVLVSEKDGRNVFKLTSS
jgi:acetyl-CoA C-acetyltransferase